MSTQEKTMLVNTDKCAQCSLCQLMCSFTYTQRFNLSRSRIHVDLSNREITFTEECNHCGTCARYCGYGALTIEN